MYRQLSAQLLGKEAGAAGAELSAPYEVPQFPIEQIQSKLARVRVKVSNITLFTFEGIKLQNFHTEQC